ncbi:hypothetical protein Vadar_023420 [Vaccinium darrowii]|uniref:Uncharacterized protein n=1 Tax=Vaccinium darrowii TaxID=229202 RepID=A0ACB7Y193_9ERIC|nr:hypothetical protein Vadar_023420 [Vaccinium darrowii]
MKVMDPEASVLGGDFQSRGSRRKLDFDNDGDFPEITVVSGDEGDQNGFQNSTPTVNDIGLIHSRISKESIPQLDMDFLTEEAAYNFYNSYAYKVGFSIRRHKEHRDKSGKITSRTFCCSCEGKGGADKRDVIVKCHRPETRFGCLARMKIRYCRVTQKYLVFEFGAVHNHTLCSPSKTHLFRSHRNFAPAQVVEADMANDSGIAPEAIVEFMSKQVGGRENLGFIPQDYKNYLHSKRSVQMKMGDTGGNAAKQLSGVFAEFKDFAKDFSSCIYDYEDEAGFIIAWNEMLATYGLQENEWLRRMLIDDRRYEELKADFRATQSIPCLSFPVQILRHALGVYTPKVFELFRAELCKAWDCNMDEWTEDGTVTAYKITPYRKSHHHVVTYDSTEGTLSCSCKKFEFVGILCAHALKVLSSKRIVKIPDRYILKRWTMNAKSGNTIPTCLSSIPEDPTAMMGRRYKELCRLHTHLATRAAETEKAYGIVVDGLNKILEEVEASLTGVETDEGVETNETFLGSQNGVFEDNEAHDEGIGKKVKGLKVKEKTNGKSSKRPKSALERATRN